jgi:hypothetical protein
VPAVEEVEREVKSAWLAEQKTMAWDKAYKDMRAKYTVLLPAPPDDQSASVSASPLASATPGSAAGGTP